MMRSTAFWMPYIQDASRQRLCAFQCGKSARLHSELVLVLVAARLRDPQNHCPTRQPETLRFRRHPPAGLKPHITFAKRPGATHEIMMPAFMATLATPYQM